MGVSSRALEITVISCENLRVTEEPYVVVRAESLNCCTTKVAKGSGSDETSTLFSWNEKFTLNIPMYARSVTFQVQCNKFKALRPVAVARIALSDILNDAVLAPSALHVFSYRLRDWEGKRNGVIHFAVRAPAVTEKCCGVATVDTVAGDKISGYPLTRINACGNNSNGVVAGAPFWWNSPNIV